jgi:hypothetical protein
MARMTFLAGAADPHGTDGSDNVMIHIWRDFYVREIRIWRHALQTLPAPVAHRIAHENAERLWHLAATPPRSATSAAAPTVRR